MTRTHPHQQGPPAAPEATGLTSAIGYAQGMAAAFDANAATAEQWIASLEYGGEVRGAAIAAARAAVDKHRETAAAWSACAAALTGQVAVREAYQAAPGAGTREFVTGGSVMPDATTGAAHSHRAEPPARDTLRLSGRVTALAEGERLVGSGAVEPDNGEYLVLAAVDGPAGRRVRFGRVEDRSQWRAGPDGLTVQLDAAGVAALCDGLVDGMARARDVFAEHAALAKKIDAEVGQDVQRLRDREEQLRRRLQVGPVVKGEMWQAAEADYERETAELARIDQRISELRATRPPGGRYSPEVERELVDLVAQREPHDADAERARRDIRLYRGIPRTWRHRAPVPEKLTPAEHAELAAIPHQIAELMAPYPEIDTEQEVAVGVIRGVWGDVEYRVEGVDDGAHSWEVSVAVLPAGCPEHERRPEPASFHDKQAGQMVAVLDGLIG